MFDLEGNNNEELKNHCLTTMLCLLFLVVMGITLFYVWLTQYLTVYNKA